MYKSQVSLKARALRFLSMREHSRVELARKLTRYASETDDIEEVLNFLEQANFLSDARFSESLVNRRQERFGNQKILAELQSHGLEKEKIAKLKSELTETEVTRAIEVLHRKFQQTPIDANERVKQMRFLQQRGFSGRSIELAIRATRNEEKDTD